MLFEETGITDSDTAILIEMFRGIAFARVAGVNLLECCMGRED